ncbi:MAG TPA: hypothetical protein VGH91_09465 [Gammaproteobacteria bacterium]|jgi:hypothetical protein
MNFSRKFLMLVGLSSVAGAALSSPYQTVSVYDGLRNQLLSLKPSDIGTPLAGNGKVLAVLMETGYPKAVATVVAVADGSASIYFSNGGGIIGAGAHPQAREKAVALIDLISKNLSEFSKISTYPLPDNGLTRFYVVTADGIYSASAKEDDLGNRRSDLSPIFYVGQDLITAIRLTSPNQK